MTGFNDQEYLKNVTFHYKDELVLFDANGDPPGHYDIMNFQRVCVFAPTWHYMYLANHVYIVSNFSIKVEVELI